VTEEDRALGQIALGTAKLADVGHAPDSGLLPWAARREDLQLTTRLLDAGTDIDAGEDMPPLHNACYAGRLAAVQLLLARGADLHKKNAYGGDALGSAIYGSVDCCDPDGGPGSLTLDEITHGDYGAIVELLLAAGARPPKHATGSEAVREVLRRHGVLDAD
jgi:ankyrin repeat protein